MQTMASFLTKIFCISLLASVLSVFALHAQTTVSRFILLPSEQSVFWENIQNFKPYPLENQGDTATFNLSSPASLDSFFLSLLDHFRRKSFLLVSIDSFRTPNTNLPIYQSAGKQSTNLPIPNPGACFALGVTSSGGGFRR